MIELDSARRTSELEELYTRTFDNNARSARSRSVGISYGETLRSG